MNLKAIVSKTLFGLQNLKDIIGMKHIIIHNSKMKEEICLITMMSAMISKLFFFLAKSYKIIILLSLKQTKHALLKYHGYGHWLVIGKKKNSFVKRN